MDTREAFESYWFELLGYAEKRVGSAAEDLVQTAFTKLMEYPVAVRAPKRFLYHVLTNSIINHRKQQDRHRRLLENAWPQQPPKPERPADYLIYVEQSGKIKRLIRKMSPVVGDVLVEGLSYSEAAEKHGLAPATIRQAVARARKRIRDQLVE